MDPGPNHRDDIFKASWQKGTFYHFYLYISVNLP